MEESKISIIVPVYNTGQMLERCIESILAQTMKEIEVIIVDDGSTDESSEICDRFAERDKRLKVIHKKNEGVSIARNTGIQMATGEYIGFVDSDDWINDNMYLDLYDKAKKQKSDIVMCDAVTVYDDGSTEPDTITQLLNSILLDKLDIAPKLLLELAGAAWRCIYRRDLLIDNNIKFPTGLKFSEDRIFNILAMGKCSSLYYIKEPYYNRYIRKGSAVNKYYENMLDIILDARERTMNAIDTAWGGDQSYKDMYENQTAGFALTAINNEFYKDAKGSFILKYKTVKEICNNDVIRNSIKVTNRNDIRSRLVIHRMTLSLCMIAMILNKKHGR